MITPISPSSIPAIADISASGSTTASAEFASVLESAVRQVEGSRSSASAEVQKFITGETDELHTTALAIQKSELEFEMFLQVRNKVIQAYQEIMRSQI